MPNIEEMSKKFQNLEGEVNQAEQDVQRLKGERGVLAKTLKEKYGVNSNKETVEKLEELKEEERKAKEKLEELYEQVTEDAEEA